MSGWRHQNGEPGSSDTRQFGQWLTCQTAPKGPFEGKRVSPQVSKFVTIPPTDAGFAAFESLQMHYDVKQRGFKLFETDS
jgi:hypothetical protein